MKLVKSKSAILGLVALIGGILGMASSAQAQIYTTSANYGSYTQGAWTIYNDVWGTKRKGTQTLYVNSINSWYVTTNQPNTSGVKSYPNTSVSPHTPLAQMQSATMTYDTTSPVSVSGYWWDWTTDLWSPNGADEVMIFTNWYPNTGDGGWGTKIASNVTIGGVLYLSVWQAAPGWNVLQFKPAGTTNSGTIDCLAVWQWAASQGLLTNTTFDQMQFGVEITSTNGTLQRFSMNSFHASWTNKSGGGSGI